MRASANELLAYLQLIAWKLPESSLTQRVNDLRSSYLKLLDPVWGGVYLSITERDPERPLDPRKRLSAQAAALQVFAAAYQATTEQRYAQALSAVDEYLQGSLAVSDGSYYAGQLPQPENLPAHVSVYRYWALRTEHERRRFGIPEVDQDVPTAANAKVISGYALGYAATGETFFLRVAVRTGRNLLETRRTSTGLFAEPTAGSVATQPSLENQGLMGLALLDLYQVSADPEWLLAATLTARAIDDHADWDDAGEGAVTAAEFLHRLSRLRNDPSWRAAAGDLLRGVIAQPLPREALQQLARLGRVLENYKSGYVELVISGAPEMLATRQLYAAALAAYQPGKLVMMDRFDRFPETDSPALHICTVNGCLPPINDPTELRAVLDSLDPVAGSR